MGPRAQLVLLRAPQMGLCGVVVVVCCGSPQPQGCSQPCGPGAPSPSRCGCAAALPSLPSAAPAEGEDRGWDVPRDKGNILGPLIP